MASLRLSSAATVKNFMSQQTFAFVGVSRTGKKFANAAYRELRSKGYTLVPVNPSADTVEGERCYQSLLHLPCRVDGAIVMVPREQTVQVVRDAAAAGIRRIWIQQGAESQAALDACTEAGISVIAGECILMFTEPAHWLHRTHRFGRRLLGSLPR
jgi:hypothetical protein